MKHNGDNDASLKPRFLPDMTAAHSTQPASPPPRYRWTPCSHHISLRESTYRAAGVNRFISLNVLPQKNLSYFQKIVTVSSASPLHRTGLLIWKGFQGKTVIDFHTLVFLPPSQTAIIIHSRWLGGDDAQLTLSLDGFVAADLKQEWVSEPQISLSQGATNL